jgi:phage replication-related protein YjqB (UPF0714/DUF867 family)
MKIHTHLITRKHNNELAVQLELSEWQKIAEFLKKNSSEEIEIIETPLSIQNMHVESPKRRKFSDFILDL